MSVGAIGMYDLLRCTERARLQLREHDLYRELNELRAIRIFMEHHVFAVWDFMSLLKELQWRLTSVGTPWIPTSTASLRRFINEIVTHEESDDVGSMGTLSHFELYLRAMDEIGAECGPILRFVEKLRAGDNIDSALSSANAPSGAHAFVTTTFGFIKTGKPHVVAAAFTFGREEPIPGMFRSLVAALDRHFDGGSLPALRIYLDRHIALDEDSHGPMAIRMLAHLCADDETFWAEAKCAALAALAARLALWNSISCEIEIDKADCRSGLAA